MKYSVLIADDEPLARKGLGALIRSRSAEWEVRGLFSNGSQALAAAKEDPVDIILADIRMPRVDGLQLTRALRVASPDTVVIVMSGFKEFDYARTALKSSVLDFLVKPIEEDELFSALDRARAEIERRRTARRQAVLARNPDTIKDALLAEVLTAADSTGPAAQLCEFLGVELGTFFALCTQIVPSGPAEEPLATERAGVERHFQEGPDAAGFHLFSFQDYLVALVMDGKATLGGSSEPSPADLTAAKISNLLGRRARVGVSLFHQGSGEIRAACEEASCAMQAGYYGAPGEVVHFMPTTPDVPRYPAAAAEKIASCLLAGDRQAAEACARDLLAGYSRDRVSPSFLDEHLGVVMRHVQERLAPVLPDPDGLRALTESLVPVYKFGWFDRLRTELLATVGELSVRVDTANQRRLGRAVMRAIHYIEDNYGRDLPLEDIAKSVSLSPSYFSSCFKKETGKNVVEYITEFRVEKASELLCSTNLNASEVAYRVGFNDPKYFARIFKRSVGVTPSEYRRYSRER